MSINPGGRAITTLSCRLRRFFPLPFPVMAIFLSPPLFLPFLPSFHPSPAPDSSQQEKWVKKGKKRRQSFLIKFTGNEVILDRDRVSRGVCEFHNRLNGFPLGLFLLRAPDEKQSHERNAFALFWREKTKRRKFNRDKASRNWLSPEIKSNNCSTKRTWMRLNDAVERRASRFLENAMEEDRKGIEREREGRGRQDGSLSRESLCTLRYARVAPMWRHFRRPQPPSEPVYHRSSLFLPSASPFSLSLSFPSTLLFNLLLSMSLSFSLSLRFYHSLIRR